MLLLAGRLGDAAVDGEFLQEQAGDAAEENFDDYGIRALFRLRKRLSPANHANPRDP